MNADALLTPRPAKRAALRSAYQRLAIARGPVGLALGAALTEPLVRTPRQWAEMLLLAAVPLAALLALSRWLLLGWHEVLLWWAPSLGLPLQRGSADPLTWHLLEGAPGLGGPLALAGMALLALTVLTASLWLRPHQHTLRRGLWALGALQAGVVVLATVAPAALAQSPAAYLSALLYGGLCLMLALPVLLAVGLSGLNMGRAQRVGWMGALLAYFSLVLPHKMLLLALVLNAMPLVWGPLLFVLLGPVADLLLLLACLACLSARYPAIPVGPPRRVVATARRR